MGRVHGAKQKIFNFVIVTFASKGVFY